MLVFGVVVGVLSGVISSLMIKIMESTGLTGGDWLIILFVVLITFASFVIVPFLPQYRKWLKIQLYNEVYDEIHKIIKEKDEPNP